MPPLTGFCGFAGCCRENRSGLSPFSSKDFDPRRTDGKTSAMTQILRIGTRASALALRQTDMVAEALRVAHPQLNIEIVRITTSGDWRPADGETRLVEAQGGKGLFAREIEAAILDRRVDCGVHSMKDMPSFLPDGLVIRHMLKREDARDAFLANGCKAIRDLPRGARFGTSSLRRQAFILGIRPDLEILPLRGNVPTRIEKLRTGQVDATLLACAGLNRLGLESEITSILAIDDMLPAAGQGAVGIETREGDAAIQALFDPLHCRSTGLRVAAERAALQILNGSCHTPIGAYAVLADDDLLTLRVAVASADGKEMHRVEQAGIVASDNEAAGIGEAVGADLRARVPAHLLT